MCITLYNKIHYFSRADIKMKKQCIFKGAATALITPMRGEKIDYTALEKIIDFQLDGGIKTLVIGGTTGEAATLCDRERYELFRFTRSKTLGRAKLIFGTGTNDTRMAINHTKIAESIGCDGILAVTPYYNKGTHRGVLEHYRRLAGSCNLPIILYNVPGRTGVNLTIKQLEELAKIDTVVGIKEAGDSADRLCELSAFGEDLWLYAGNDTQIYQTLALGGAGVISVVSNIYPRLISDICESYFAGKAENSHRGQLDIMGFTKAMFCETNPAPIKYAMSLYGLCKKDIRLPLYPPEAKSRSLIRKECKRIEEILTNTFSY
jgi:4-hydroxy-tetrahydrodipicolinate synthase